MDQSELLKYVAFALDRMRISYLVTGSVATILYGEPRLTNDIDIVIRLPAPRIPEFCHAFSSPDFYLSEDNVRQAVESCGQFNVIHAAGGLRVDFIVPRDSPFERSRFSRTIRVQAEPGCEAVFAVPEDVIVKKLEYYAAGGSEKHLRDIAGVLKISGARVDRAYVARWAQELSLMPAWEAVLARVTTGDRSRHLI